jgi:hypothetical protein
LIHRYGHLCLDPNISPFQTFIHKNDIVELLLSQGSYTIWSKITYGDKPCFVLIKHIFSENSTCATFLRVKIIKIDLIFLVNYLFENYDRVWSRGYYKSTFYQIRKLIIKNDCQLKSVQDDFLTLNPNFLNSYTWKKKNIQKWSINKKTNFLSFYSILTQTNKSKMKAFNIT